MFPERFLSSRVRKEQVSSVLCPPFLGDQLMCLLQLSEVGQSLEHVCSQAANAVVGQIAGGEMGQRSASLSLE